MTVCRTVQPPNKKWHHFGLVLITLWLATACLNNSNNNSGPATREFGNADGVTALSPQTIDIVWDKAVSAASYNLYTVTDEDKALAKTPFNNVRLTFTPNTYEQLKLYSVSSDGKQGLQAYRYFEFQTLSEFSSAKLAAVTKDNAGIQITWDYNPWKVIPPSTGADTGAQVKCFFLRDGTVDSDPFDLTKKPIVVTANLKDLGLAGGLNLEPSTTYAIGCETVFIDGFISKYTQNFVVKSAQTLVDDKNSPFITFYNPIQISRAISFFVSKANNGNATLKISSVTEDNTVSSPIFTLNKNNFSINGDLVSFETPIPNIPSANIYGGKYRIDGAFLSNKTGQTLSIAPKEFYVKSADDPRQVLYPAVPSVSAAQAMGASLATGDFNCDGIDDLAVGLPGVGWKDPSSSVIHKTGVVLIYYGSAQTNGKGLYYDGVAPSFNSPDIADPSNANDPPTPRPPLILRPEVDGTDVTRPYAIYGDHGQAAGEVRFGAALAVGNFNRDFKDSAASTNTFGLKGGRACQDLAIGAPGEMVKGDSSAGGGGGGSNPNFRSAGGSVYIAYGSAAGLSNNGWISVTKAFTPVPGSCPGGSPQGSTSHPSNFQANSTTGIYPNYQYPGVSCAGTRIYPFVVTDQGASECFSDKTGTRAPCVSSVGNPAKHDSSKSYYMTSEFYPFLQNSVNNGYGAQFGSSLAVGDFDNDGYDDLIVGAPNADNFYAGSTPSLFPSQYSSAGAAFVYFGSKAGIFSRFLGDGQSSNPPTSPVKIMLTPSLRTSNQNLGSAVAIAMTALGDPNTSNSELLASPQNILARAFVGAPGAGGGQGLVAGVPYPDLIDASHTRGYSYILAGASKIGRSPGGSAGTDANDILWGESAGSRYGSAITVGAFRNPRLDDGESGSIKDNSSGGYVLGLQRTNRMPLRQAVAIGAPGYSNNAGRVYVWTEDSFSATGSAPNLYYSPSGNGTNLFSQRQGITLCDSSGAAGKCLGTILDKPSTIDKDFGAVLATIKAPAETVQCTNVTCGDHGYYPSNGNSGTDIHGRWQPIYSKSLLDGLLVGAPKASTQAGAAFRYTGDLLNGLNGSTELQLRLANGFSHINDAFGSALTGGYYTYLMLGSHVVVGAPNQSEFKQVNAPAGQASQSKEILGGGSAFLFPSTSPSSFNSTSDIDLATSTPDPSGAFALDLSVVSRSGWERARYIGDVNCDGYADVAIPHNQSLGVATRTDLLILYGSPKGLVTTLPDGTSAIPESRASSARLFAQLGAQAPQWISPTDWNFSDDPDPLANFAGVGDINGDGCDDLVAANKHVVVIHGSTTGLVVNPPSDTPTGKNPKIVKMPDISSLVKSDNVQKTNPIPTMAPGDTYTPANNFEDFVNATPVVGAAGVYPRVQPDLTQWQDWNLTGAHGATIPGARAPICHGDFNGDGYDDIVIGSVNTYDMNRSWGAPDPNNPNPQTATLATWGSTAINAQLFVFYGGPNGIQDARNFTVSDYAAPGAISSASTENIFDSSCAGSTCRPAILFDPNQFLYAGSGQAYEPFRVWRDSNIRAGSPLQAQANIGKYYKSITDRFGELCESVGDLDGDGKDDLVVPLPFSQNRKASFVVFFGSSSGLRNGKVSSADAYPPSRIVNLSMMTPGTDPNNNNAPYPTTATTSTANLQNGFVGASSAGLGDLNGDNYADFVLGVPNLVGKDGTPNTGAVALIYGRPSFGLDANVSTGTTPRSDTFAAEMPYRLCDEPGISCSFGGQKMGHLLRPDTFSGVNTGKHFGTYVDAAGRTNPDERGNDFPDLLVSMPNYSPPGLYTGIGAAIVYFGQSAAGGGDVAAGGGSPYATVDPTENANCDQSGRCKPLIIIPEFALADIRKSDQNWLARGGMIVRPGTTTARYRYADFGSGNSNSVDATARSSDIILLPQNHFPHNVFTDFEHLGGLLLWK